MSRSELEQEVFNSLKPEENEKEIWEQIRSASSEDLEFYLSEYKEYLRFVAAVESLALKEQ